MKGNIVQLVAVTTVILGALAIVFVKAGQKGGMSGGQQAATIMQAGGTSYAAGVSALEGGA